MVDILKQRFIAHTGNKAQLIGRLEEFDKVSDRLGKVSRDAIEKSSPTTSSKRGSSVESDDRESASTSSAEDADAEQGSDSSSNTEQDENPRAGKHLENFCIDSDEPAQEDNSFIVDAFLMDVDDPEISGKVSCPASANMYQLHLALNTALGELPRLAVRISEWRCRK